MKVHTLYKLYKVNGLYDYKLKNTDDLLRCHSIDYKQVDGFNHLNDINKKIYKNFIINIFNGLSLESRDTLIPKSIYYVEDIEYLSKEKLEDDYYVITRRIIKSIDRNGKKTIIHDYNDYEHSNLNPIKTDTQKYLRFEYELNGKKEWLHIIDEGNGWY